MSYGLKTGTVARMECAKCGDERIHAKLRCVTCNTLHPVAMPAKDPLKDLSKNRRGGRGIRLAGSNPALQEVLP